MKRHSYWKKGAILLQTLVMSVLLSLISVMILKWVLARYIIANRVKSSAVNTGNAQGFATNCMNVSSWASATPPNKSATIDSKAVSFQQVSAGKFQTTVTDQY